MKLFVLVFLFIIKFSFYSFTQPAQVNSFNESEFKSITGPNSMIFHQSSYFQNDKSVRVFLVEGKYWLFPAKDFSFDDNIKIKSVSSELELIRKQNHYEFNVGDIGTYDFNISAKIPEDKSKELLYVIYKAYNPNESKVIDSFSYQTLDGQKISSEGTEKQYSVIYFTASKDLINLDQIERLNRLKHEFKNVQFISMFSESKDELASFKNESNFNWNLIPSVNSKELANYQIGRLLSEPSIFLLDNEKNEIIYFYYGTYDLPMALKEALQEL